MKCIKCGGEIPDNAKFCPLCGQNNSHTPSFCMYCGSPVAADTKFCENCGKPIEQLPTQTSETSENPGEELKDELKGELKDKLKEELEGAIESLVSSEETVSVQTVQEVSAQVNASGAAATASARVESPTRAPASVRREASAQTQTASTVQTQPAPSVQAQPTPSAQPQPAPVPTAASAPAQVAAPQIPVAPAASAASSVAAGVAQAAGTAAAAGVKTAGSTAKIVAIWAAVIAFVIGAAAACLNFFVPAPEDTVEKLITSVEELNYENMLSCFDSTTENQIRAVMGISGDLFGSLTGISIDLEDLMAFAPSLAPYMETPDLGIASAETVLYADCSKAKLLQYCETANSGGSIPTGYLSDNSIISFLEEYNLTLPGLENLIAEVAIVKITLTSGEVGYLPMINEGWGDWRIPMTDLVGSMIGEE